MGNYIKDAFARTNLQYIREFIMSGAELVEPKDEPYHVRLKKESDPIFNRLKSLYPNEDELDKANADLARALSSYEDVHMEMGMKIGARLIYQLLISND